MQNLNYINSCFKPQPLLENSLDPLHKLPPEMCLKIFSYLDPISVIHARQVCKQWQQIIPTLGAQGIEEVQIQKAKEQYCRKLGSKDANYIYCALAVYAIGFYYFSFVLKISMPNGIYLAIPLLLIIPQLLTYQDKGNLKQQRLSELERLYLQDNPNSTKREALQWAITELEREEQFRK